MTKIRLGPLLLYTAHMSYQLPRVAWDKSHRWRQGSLEGSVQAAVGTLQGTATAEQLNITQLTYTNSTSASKLHTISHTQHGKIMTVKKIKKIVASK